MILVVVFTYIQVMKAIMICQQCKGLGSIIKTSPSGEFKIKECSCRFTHKRYFCHDTGVTLEVTEVAGGVMSILEHHPSKKIRRIINQWLFENDLREGIIKEL